MGHALMENRTVRKPGATLGADKAYDAGEYVADLRGQRITTHVAQKAKGSAIDGRTTRHAGYRTRITIRKRVEEVFGWSKTIGGLRKTRFRRLAYAETWTATVTRTHGIEVEIVRHPANRQVGRC